MVALTLNNAATALRQVGRVEEADRFQLEALAIQERLLGPEHVEVAGSLGNLAYGYRERGELEKALELYNRSRPIFEKNLGPGNFSTAGSYQGTGITLSRLGRHAEALPYLRSPTTSSTRSRTTRASPAPPPSSWPRPGGRKAATVPAPAAPRSRRWPTTTGSRPASPRKSPRSKPGSPSIAELFAERVPGESRIGIGQPKAPAGVPAVAPRIRDRPPKVLILQRLAASLKLAKGLLYPRATPETRLAAFRQRSSRRNTMTIRARVPRLLATAALLLAAGAAVAEPLAFEPNLGQTDASVAFLSRTQDGLLFLTAGEIARLDQTQAAGGGRRLRPAGRPQSAARRPPPRLAYPAGRRLAGARLEAARSWRAAAATS